KCARELVGTELVWGKCSGKIVETEADLAENDEACHTFSRSSARAFMERNKAGAAYIYFSYGAHWMLNVLVKGETNGFVLIRAAQPLRGIEFMKKRRKLKDLRQLCSGPGKLTQAFDITDRHNEIDLCVDPRHCFAYDDDDVDVVADEADQFERTVIDYFTSEYQAGRTPNPCVMCNEKLKFGNLWGKAEALGCDYIATGHYAIIEHHESAGAARTAVLRKGVDARKDQSYFLFSLRQPQLRRALTPLGTMRKPEIRKIAH